MVAFGGCQVGHIEGKMTPAPLVLGSTLILGIRIIGNENLGCGCPVVLVSKIMKDSNWKDRGERSKINLRV